MSIHTVFLWLAWIVQAACALATIVMFGWTAFWLLLAATLAGGFAMVANDLRRGEQRG